MTNKMYSHFLISVALTIALFTLCNSQGGANYFGKFIGSLKQYHHALQGDVYAVDSRTIHVRNFNYDGEGPAGYFYVTNGKSPSENGIKLRDERGSSGPLKRYRKKHITLTLPEGKTINNIKWLYVWCDEFAVNFGDVKIPKNLDFPKPQKIGKLSGVHMVTSDNIVIVDAQTLLIPAFSYDGEAPDAKFWVGTGTKPTPQGIRVPDENGKTEPLRKYDKKTIVLTLPSDITVFDIGNFAVWCEAFTVDFGHVEIPKDLNVPPSLKMLGVSPQKLSHFRSESPYSLYSELPEHEPDLEAHAATRYAHIIKIRDTFDNSTTTSNNNNSSDSNIVRLSNNGSNSTYNASGNQISIIESPNNASSTIVHPNCTQYTTTTTTTERSPRANPLALNDEEQNKTTANASLSNSTQTPYTDIKYLKNDTLLNESSTLAPPMMKPNRTRNGGRQQPRLKSNSIEIFQSVSTEYEPLIDDSVFKPNLFESAEYGPPTPASKPSWSANRNKKHKNKNASSKYPATRVQPPAKRAPISWNVSPQHKYTFPEIQPQSTSVVRIIDIDGNVTSTEYNSSPGDRLIRAGSPFRSVAAISEDYRTIGSSLTVGKIRPDEFRVEDVETADEVDSDFGTKESTTASSVRPRGSNVRKSTSARKSTRNNDERRRRGDKKYGRTEKSQQRQKEGRRKPATGNRENGAHNDEDSNLYDNRQPSNIDDNVSFIVLPGQILPTDDVLSLNSLESAVFLSSYDLPQTENETVEELPTL